MMKKQQKIIYLIISITRKNNMARYFFVSVKNDIIKINTKLLHNVK